MYGPVENLVSPVIYALAVIVVVLDQLVSKGLQRIYFLLLSIDGSVEVFMLLYERVNGIFGGLAERSLTCSHPRLRLLTVTVEQLQLQTLVQFSTACNPSPER